MAGKVEKVLAVVMLAMLLFSEHLMAANHEIKTTEDNSTISPFCLVKCLFGCRGLPPVQASICAAQCYLKCRDQDAANIAETKGIIGETAYNQYDVGCALGYCSEFLLNYDEKRFKCCMEYCREDKMICPVEAAA
ncbi:uncharacterized protein LOC142162625 [Nicotiana tabacum]|uniref:Uncharacterized protein LOC142162625 n=1 Tax=Nicotiana tabacum TaxID=4097 RepID=A0AC58RQG5_TOBAC